MLSMLRVSEAVPCGLSRLLRNTDRPLNQVTVTGSREGGREKGREGWEEEREGGREGGREGERWEE